MERDARQAGVEKEPEAVKSDSSQWWDVLTDDSTIW